jgi:UDP-N-acetylglucosamine 2-epimerase (non-hydrolysing)
MFSAVLFSLFVKRPEVIIATSPQFFCGCAGAIVSRLRRVPFILEIRDIWPESIVAVGALGNKWLLRFLEWLELRMYAAARHIVTVGQGYRQKLIEKGIRAEAISVITNGFDHEIFYPRQSDEKIRQRYNLNHEFVCSYVGTIGMACGLEVVLRTAKLLKNSRRNDIKFLLVGAGAVKEQLQRQALEENLDNVVFIGRQDRHLIPGIVSVSDACLVHLKKRDLFKTVLPSKIFEATAMAKPIIMGVEGYAAEFLKEANAGVCIEPENAEQLTEAVENLANDRQLCHSLGQAGYEYVTKHHDRDSLANDYLDTIVRFSNPASKQPRPDDAAMIWPPKPSIPTRMKVSDTMKIINVVGARPNFMKVAPIMTACRNSEAIEPLLVHTGQHYDEKMSDLFFRQLGIPEPDVNLEVGSASHAVQTAEVMKAFEHVVLEHEPDAVLVVGDVNSTIACGLVAVKLGVKLIHIEAGLRSFDRSMPEEINRLLTDSLSDFLFCSEQSGVDNLIRESISKEKIFLVGNVMIDTLLNNKSKANKSNILDQLNLNGDGYAVLTLHRPVNVDNSITFGRILDALEVIQNDIPIIFPIHPRTRRNVASFHLGNRLEELPNLRLIDPLGYLDFLKLMTSARLVLTDSGGIQEETTILKVPCLTLRENTERPITAEIGSSQIVGTDPDKISQAYRQAINGNWRESQIPPLWDGCAAERIVKTLLEGNPKVRIEKASMVKHNDSTERVLVTSGGGFPG